MNNFKSFTSVLLLSLAFSSAHAVSAGNELSKAPSILVGYFSPESKSQFAEKVKPLFEKNTNSCRACQIVDLTPYNEKGDYDSAALEKSIKEIPGEIKILFFNFNTKKGEVSQVVIDALNKYSEQGSLVVASAGAPKENQASGPLSKTLFGQIKEALIIGELGERERLLPQSFFGPEMLTALRSPKDIQGSGVGALLFASRLASNYSRKSPQQWTEHFKNKKMKSRKIWPDLEDLF